MKANDRHTYAEAMRWVNEYLSIEWARETFGATGFLYNGLPTFNGGSATDWLPGDHLTIYRASSSDRVRRAAWTHRREIAVSYGEQRANEIKDDVIRLWEGRISPKHVFAVFDFYPEHAEVVIEPDALTNVLIARCAVSGCRRNVRRAGYCGHHFLNEGGQPRDETDRRLRMFRAIQRQGLKCARCGLPGMTHLDLRVNNDDWRDRNTIGVHSWCRQKTQAERGKERTRR